MQYDLLTEPWIKVKYDGKIKKVGLADLFENATTYEDVVGLSKLQTSEYEIYRFFIAIFMDAYRERLGSNEEVFDIYFENGFDMERICSYFSMCKQEGHPFDLLDKENLIPHMPSRYEVLFCHSLLILLINTEDH